MIIYPWKCPHTYTNKITAIVNLPSGLQESQVNVQLLDDKDNVGVSQELEIKYPWSQRFLSAEDVFKTRANANTDYYMYPEAQGFLKALKKVRNKIDEIPDTTMIINLPFKVQSNSQTWSYSFRSMTINEVKNGEGTKKELIVIICMTGVVEKYLQVLKRPANLAYNSDDNEADEVNNRHEPVTQGLVRNNRNQGRQNKKARNVNRPGLTQMEQHILAQQLGIIM